MKKIAFVITVLILLHGSNVFCEENIENSTTLQKSTINVLSTPELYDLASRWAQEYWMVKPGVKINVIKANNTGDAGMAGADLGFISGEYTFAGDGAPIWKMAVGRDVIVPVISLKNPYSEEIYKKGITPEELAQIIDEPEKRIWGNVVGNEQKLSIHIYILNDESVISSVGKFLSISRIPANGIYFVNADELITSIQADPYAIGFCKVANIIGTERLSMIEGISIMPLDKNGNGSIDYTEDIYNNLDAFTRGVWIGKYPRVLTNDVYCVSESQPVSETDIAFIKWVLINGQQFLPMAGFTDLAYGERQSNLARIHEINVIQIPSRNFYFLTPWVFIIIAFVVVVSLVISFVVYYRKSKKVSLLATKVAGSLQFSGSSAGVPKGLYYDKTHTWAFMEKDGMVKIGIDDFLQHVTGPVTRIEMRKAGEKFRKGDMILSIIQNGKRLTLYSPVSGVVIENNKMLTSNSSLINTSPYSEGWVYRIEPSNWIREIQFLDMAGKYKAWLSHEFSKLKDFIAISIKIEKAELEAVVLQDGGTLKGNILEEFGPEVWEDFQHHFLDMND